MRSLWSGVSGLQAHQVGMDVEGHNIANVNTVGYKYGRVSFADQISQTIRTATGPHSKAGGKNSMQIGLGVTAEATTKVFKGGSLETTDVGTDLAIEGDSFFVVSDNGGRTNKYTRNGEFTRDGMGNLVNNSGYIVQGWMQDPVTKRVDPTKPIEDITIPEGLKAEAMATDYVGLKANLNSGNEVGEFRKFISSLDVKHGKYREDKNSPFIDHDEEDYEDYKFNKDQEMVEVAYDMGVVFNDAGSSLALRQNQGIWVSYKNAIYSSDDAISATDTDIKFELNGVEITGKLNKGSSEKNAQELLKIINLYTSKTGVVATIKDVDVGGNKVPAGITLTNDNRTGTLESSKNIKITIPNGGGETAGLTAGNGGAEVITAHKYQYVKNGANYEAYHSGNTTAIGDKDARIFTTTEDLRAWLHEDAAKSVMTGAAKTFDLSDIDVTVNKVGQFEIKKNTDNMDLDVSITGFSNDELGVNGIAENSKFTAVMKNLEGRMTKKESFRTSQSLCLSSMASSQDIYDTLGSKHNLRIEYTKINNTLDNGTEWIVKISVPEPGFINDTGAKLKNKNIVTGRVRFDSRGALSSYSPPSISYNPNNGAASEQIIKFNLGEIGGFDGLTSYDQISHVSNKDVNGYAGGNIENIRIDDFGNIIGTFTNDQIRILGQVALARFTNNEGLEATGGNMFLQTANSGEPTIGTAKTGGRGTIKSNRLEMSNVDLSRSLTKLIVIQRGFQANSKTITTSDQMLNTLLQLKQ